MPPSRQLIVSSRAQVRIAAARSWLEALPPACEALVIASNPEAGDDLVRSFAERRGAIFGIQRLTLNRLIGILAAPDLVASGRVAAAGLAAEAVAARAVFRLKGDSRLEYFAPVISRPGFPGALARTLAELRLAEITPSALEQLDQRGVALAHLLNRFATELSDANLVDRAAMITAATAAIATDSTCQFARMPTLLLDVAVATAAERELIRALAAKAPSVIATVPGGDSKSARFLEDALGVAAVASESVPEASSLARLQEHLFAGTAPPACALDESVAVCSAAGEMQECVEIARRIQAEAKRGVAFDRIAVLLHAPGRYGPYLEEALHRARIPAWFARGTSTPEPGGRALLALLACAAQGLSARRFAEYLSLAQVPSPDEASRDGVASFVAPEIDLTAAPIRATFETQAPVLESAAADPLPLVEGTVRAPWRWERVLVEAAVVGRRDRWETRLLGLEEELRLKRAELAEDDARAAALERELLDVAHLREVALPIIGALAALPEGATWAEWLEHLRALALLALRDCDAVLAALAELEPMAPVGPISLDEVRIVLAERLGRLETAATRRRYGAVLVAPASYARGLEFDVVIVPGLAERVFPKKLTEDPLLPDALRQRLEGALPVQADRVEAERLALRIAAGAARCRIIFSYPRVDLDQGRPRVPSFYALEVLRAAEGRLPGFDELARRAAGEARARLGWPAPENPADAIDAAEFDLAILDRLLDAAPAATVGAAHYLLDSNPHLGRALRARARRWLRRWTPNDGLVDPNADERAALVRHQLVARSYSATALQHFAACPYRFFLQAIIRLAPREEIEALEAIDPLTRGALYHEVQFETLTVLRAAGLLPIRRSNLEAGYQAVEDQLAAVAVRYHEELAPAIERVWLDGIESIRADLREWMRRMADDPDAFCPERFELSFGLSDRYQADPASVAAAVALDAGINLRGSIDLVERGPAGALRVTDHKTGRVRAEKNLLIGGGKTLQPVLYALAAERLLGEPVASGRLYYCTAAGNYEERIVPLDGAAREAIDGLAQTVGAALDSGFMPAAPGEGECQYCDYRLVCGPYEEVRVRIKSAGAGVRARLADLTRLREMR